MKLEHTLQRNLRALSKENPVLAREIERACYPEGWQVYPARNGMPTLEIEFEGKKLSIHSRYDPHKEAVTWCNAIDDEWDLLVIFGFGLGYHYEELASRFPDKEIIFVENDLGHLKAALSVMDRAKIIRQNGLRVVVSSDPIWNSQEVILKNMGRKITFKALPAYETAFRDYWQAWQQNALALIRQHRGDVATNIFFLKLWLENFVKNINAYYNSYPVKIFFNQFVNRPAIVVAAGPSLEKNVHLLNDLRDRAIIIAAGSAIRALEKNRVKPHLVVSIDGHENNYRHFEDFDGSDLPLVYVPIIHHRIIQEYKGPIIAAELAGYELISWFNSQLGWEPGELRRGPSVANVCFDLARKMGANPIVLVGQDLAYTNMKTHAEGAKHQKKIDPQKGNYIFVEDVFGKKVLTIPSLYNMKTWFEQYIRSMQEERLVIDATEGGARIEGTQICTLQEVADRHLREPFYPQQIIDEVLQHTADHSNSYLAKVHKIVRELLSQYEAVDNLCQEGLSFAKKLNNAVGSGELSYSTFTKALKHFRQLDYKITRLDFFQVFVKEAIDFRYQAINVVFGRNLQEAESLSEKIQSLVDLYSAFFRDTREYAAFVRQIWRENSDSF